MSSTAQERAAGMSAVGGQARFEKLARRFYARVYNYVYWLSRDPALAEDLTQETFMRVWQHPPEIRGERALTAWVYRVARNEYLQHLRRAGLETVPFDDCRESDQADSAESGPQLRLEQHELRRAVWTAVEGLPEHYREVIVLHNLEGLSLAQVAEVLEVPIGTVKSRRAKAFRLLRESLRGSVREPGS